MKRAAAMIAGTTITVAIGVACSTYGDARDEGSNGVDGAVDEASSVVPPSESDAGCDACATPAPVVTAIKNPSWIAATGGRVYWTDFTNQVTTCDPAACTPEAAFATDAGAGPGTYLFGAIAAIPGFIGALDTTCSSTDTRTEGEYIYDLPKKSLAAHGVPCPSAITSFGDQILFTNSGTIGGSLHTGWGLRRCDGSGACADIASGMPTTNFWRFGAITPAFAYGATSEGLIARWPNAPTAEAPTTLVSGEIISGLATDGTSLYWFGISGVRTCTITDCTGTVRTLSTDGTVKQMTADATGVYWTSAGAGTGDGKIIMARGGVVTPIAIGLLGPTAIALDDAWVYWAYPHDASGDQNKGSIVRRSKP